MKIYRWTNLLATQLCNCQKPKEVMLLTLALPFLIPTFPIVFILVKIISLFHHQEEWMKLNNLVTFCQAKFGSFRQLGLQIFVIFLTHNTTRWDTQIRVHWGLEDTFRPLSFFGSGCVSLIFNFYKKFPTFWRWKLTIWIIWHPAKHIKDEYFSCFHSSCQWGLRYTCTLNRRLHFLTLWHWAEIHSSICSWACHASMDYELNRNGPENIWIEQWNHKKILFLFARSLHNNQSAANNAAIFQSQGSYVY